MSLKQLLRSVKLLDSAVSILENEYEQVQQVKADACNLENDQIPDAEKKTLLAYSKLRLLI